LAAKQAGSPPVVVRGGGWGHSVGLSQYGAFAQAKAGRSHGDMVLSMQHYLQSLAEMPSSWHPEARRPPHRPVEAGNWRG
jgi:hypothetical protein